MNVLINYINELSPDIESDRRQLMLLNYILINTADGKKIEKEEAAEGYKKYAGINDLSSSDPNFFRKLPEFITLGKQDFICLSLDYRLGKTLLKFRNSYNSVFDAENYVKITELLKDKLRTSNKITNVKTPIENVNNESRLIKQIRRRIEREFDKKKYISDIRISDNEYAFLKEYLMNGLKKRTTNLDDPLFAVAVVQVACKSYNEGNFWDSFFNELGLPRTQTVIKRIGDTFYQTLVRHGKFVSGQGETRENVLLHTFVSDNALEAYFTFLFRFYLLDLNRDIEMLDKEQIDELVESICLESAKGRTYMLLQHTRQAVAANKTGAKIRLRNQIKRMNRLFMRQEDLKKTDHRIYAAMDEWAARNEEFIIERDRSREVGRSRGSKRFASPYYHFDRAAGEFLLILPEQRISFEHGTDISWVIPEYDKTISAELSTNYVSSYRTGTEQFKISASSMLNGYTAYLQDGSGDTIRRFPYPATAAVFFDSDGDQVSLGSIREGLYSSISRPDEQIESSGLDESGYLDDMLLSNFTFQYEDMIRLSDGTATMIGRKNIDNSLLERGRIEEAFCVIEEKRYPLYSDIPYITVRTSKERINGTVISVDGKIFSFRDLIKTDFDLNDGTGDVGCYISLADIVQLKDGYHRIVVNIPPSITRDWSFCLLKGMTCQFEDAPYLFEPRGTIIISGAEVREGEKGLVKSTESDDTFQFEIEEVGRFLSFDVTTESGTLVVEIPVPALFTRDPMGNWTSFRPAELWYTDVPDLIDVSAPGRSISLYIDTDSDDEDEVRELYFEKRQGEDFFVCDIIRLKSYLSASDNVICPIGIRCGRSEEVLFRVVTRDIVVSRNIIGDLAAGTVTVNVDFLGRDDCCIDLFVGDTQLADKEDIIDYKAVVRSELGGKYRAIIYEKVEDDDGFGTDYIRIDEFEQNIIDPNDLTGRSIRLLHIREHVHGSSGKKIELSLLYQNYVTDLKRTEQKDLYTGTLVVDKSAGDHIAATDVLVKFDDIKDPEYVKVYYRDEEGDEQDFLYDIRKKGILQTENPDLNGREKYRRYTLLWFDEHDFRMDFCEMEEGDYSDLPSKILYQENKEGYDLIWGAIANSGAKAEKNTAGNIAEMKRYPAVTDDTLIKDSGIRAIVMQFLQGKGIRTVGDLRQWVKTNNVEDLFGRKYKMVGDYIKEVNRFISENDIT